MEIISINLRLRSDIDPELFAAVSELPKGKVRSEYIRRLLSQVKIKPRHKLTTHTEEKQIPSQKQVEPKNESVTVMGKQVILSTNPPPETSDFEATFASVLGGIPQR